MSVHKNSTLIELILRKDSYIKVYISPEKKIYEKNIPCLSTPGRTAGLTRENDKFSKKFPG